MGKSRAVMGDVPAYADPNITIYLDFLGADDGIRTRDPHLGKVMLYQLSHVRLVRAHSSNARNRRPRAGVRPRGPGPGALAPSWDLEAGQAQWPPLRSAAFNNSAKASVTRSPRCATSGTSSRHPRIPKNKVPS